MASVSCVTRLTGCVELTNAGRHFKAITWCPCRASAVIRHRSEIVRVQSAPAL